MRSLLEQTSRSYNPVLGHASATMTWDLYGHLYDDDLGRVAERMHDVREERVRTSCGLGANRTT
jgi:hypothetical protein